MVCSWQGSISPSELFFAMFVKDSFRLFKVLLDYVDTMTRLPKLLEQVVAENEEAETMIDGAQAAAIDDLAKRIPKIIGLLPDIFFRSRSIDDRHQGALEVMAKDLLKLTERTNPDLLVSI